MKLFKSTFIVAAVAALLIFSDSPSKAQVQATTEQTSGSRPSSTPPTGPTMVIDRVLLGRTAAHDTSLFEVLWSVQEAPQTTVEGFTVALQVGFSDGLQRSTSGNLSFSSCNLSAPGKRSCVARLPISQLPNGVVPGSFKANVNMRFTILAPVARSNTAENQGFFPSK
jgi:hypothetical protein